MVGGGGQTVVQPLGNLRGVGQWSWRQPCPPVPSWRTRSVCGRCQADGGRGGLAKRLIKRRGRCDLSLFRCAKSISMLSAVQGRKLHRQNGLFSPVSGCFDSILSAFPSPSPPLPPPLYDAYRIPTGRGSPDEKTEKIACFRLRLFFCFLAVAGGRLLPLSAALWDPTDSARPR